MLKTREFGERNVYGQQGAYAEQKAAYPGVASGGPLSGGSDRELPGFLSRSIPSPAMQMPGDQTAGRQSPQTGSFPPQPSHLQDRQGKPSQLSQSESTEAFSAGESVASLSRFLQPGAIIGAVVGTSSGPLMGAGQAGQAPDRDREMHWQASHEPARRPGDEGLHQSRPAAGYEVRGWAGDAGPATPPGLIGQPSDLVPPDVHPGPQTSNTHGSGDRVPDGSQAARGGGITPSAEDGTTLTASAMHLLVVDDDDPVRNACCEIARSMGFIVHAADSVPSARAMLRFQTVDVLLLDLKLPGGGGLLLLEETKAQHPATVVVVMTAFATVSSAVEAMRIGAADYLTKPFALEELTAMLGRASQRRHFDLESRLLREKLRTQGGEGDMIGNSPAMEKLYRILSKVVFTTHPVLILGESGTGKEMVARAIHFNGPNARKPFVPVDCSSLVPTLIESELFGYVKGAFTGANRSKEGLLASADGGTVFLDEIGELPLDLQSKLLRALQEKEVRPVGATYSVPISARVLAATNRDLAGMVEQGRFRKDLYFRLNVVNLKIPPLRERREDVPALVQHFLERKNKETGTQHILSDDALRLMIEFPWPGNVRQLEHAIEGACALSSGPVLHMGDLASPLQEFWRQSQQNLLDQRHQQTVLAQQQPLLNDTSLTTLETGETIVSIAELEKQAILNTIRQLNGDKLMAARLLQIGKTTLYRKLKEYGIAESMEEMN